MKFARPIARASGALCLLLGAAACQVLVGIDETVEQTDPAASSDGGQPLDGAVLDVSRIEGGTASGGTTASAGSTGTDARTPDAASSDATSSDAASSDATSSDAASSDAANEAPGDSSADTAAADSSFNDAATGSTGAASSSGSTGLTTGGASASTGSSTTGTGGATTGSTTGAATTGNTTGTATTGTTTGGATGGASTGGNGTTGGTTGASNGASDAGCSSSGVLYHLDRDRDGHGDPSVSSCAPGDPGLGNWVLSFDDCDDGDSSVHPGQTDYFADGYPSAAGPLSFDYDCDGEEMPDPAVQQAPSCAQITDLLLCGGSGFDPATPTRQGSGVDPYCGSRAIRTCSKSGLLTCDGTVVISADQAYRCR